jgi:hypothetical protein
MPDRPIRIPRNHTSHLQWIQRLAMTGHVFWCGDTAPRDKVPNIIGKYPSLSLRADAPARAYRKRTGRASVHMVISPALLKPEAERVCWLMLSTSGQDGLEGADAPPAPVRDLRTRGGRIVLNGCYELVRAEKSGGCSQRLSKVISTVTWRLTWRRYQELLAWLIEAAKQRDRSGLEARFDALSEMPLFAGIRRQLFRLHAETNRMLMQVGCQRLPALKLPTMRMQRLWADEYDL